MQRHHEAMSGPELNAYLDAGSLVVWVHRHDDGLLDAVLDHPEIDQSQGSVLAFLQSVNPQALDEAMTKGARLSKSLGASALEALIALAGSDERT